MSLTKLVQNSKLLLLPRFAIALQNASFQSKTLEEKLKLPQKPKRPVNTYFRFVAITRPQLIQGNPKLSVTEIIKACAIRWANANDDLKKKLADDYAKDKQQYLNQQARYKKGLTTAQKEIIQAAKQDVLESKEKRAVKKQSRALNKPKKPAAGYIRFVAESSAKIPRGSQSLSEFAQKISKNWKALSEEKKNFYNKSYKDDLVRYKRELAKWELKMVRLGNVDLVRPAALIEPSPHKRSTGVQLKTAK